MPLGLDSRLLLLGLCLGLASVGVQRLSLFSGDIKPLKWATVFLDKAHTQPYFEGFVPDQPEEESPIANWHPRVQRELKAEAAEKEKRQNEEARIHAPVYFYAGEESGAATALKRIAHELAEHVSPIALFLVTSAADATAVEISKSASLPFSVHDVFDALREHSVDAKWTETERTTIFEDLKESKHSLTLAVPSSLSHEHALATGMALHRFRELGVAFLTESSAVSRVAKIVDAMTHYTTTDRHRAASAYSLPLLSLAAGAADEAEGEALIHSSSGPLLLRFGHVEDQGHDIL